MSCAWSAYSPNERKEVEQFLRCNTGSFFHEPAFFDYHPADRFQFQHLLCRAGGKLVAWLPGHRQGAAFHSPAGASYGGPIWRNASRLEDRIRAMRALQEELRAREFTEISVKTPPAPYFGDAGFPLSATGFQLSARWACHVLHLAGEEWPQATNKTKRYDHRKALEAGLTPAELDEKHLPVFHQLLVEQTRRQKTEPTHDAEELSALHGLLPGRLRLFAAMQEGKIAAATLVLVIHPKVAYTFYIVSGEADPDSGAALVALVHAAGTLRKEGFHWLDLGPSTFDDYAVNAGLAQFKQAVGGALYTRDEWRFSLAA